VATKKKTVKKDPAKSNGKAKSNDLLRRPFLISVGALALAEERASEVIDSLIERGEEARKAGEKYMKKLNGKASKRSGKSSKAKSKGKKKAQPGEDIIARTLHWLNIPTRKEIEKLSEKVDKLTKKVA